MSRSKHLLAFAAATAVATLAIATAAQATPPAHEDIGTIPYEFTVDCNPYGFAFENQVVGEEEVTVDTFFNSQEEPRKVVVHDSFDETGPKLGDRKDHALQGESGRDVRSGRRNANRRRNQLRGDRSRPRHRDPRHGPGRLRRAVPCRVRGGTTRCPPRRRRPVRVLGACRSVSGERPEHLDAKGPVSGAFL